MILIESPHKSYRIYEGFGFSCKGRIAILFIFFFNPSVLRTPPLYFVLQKHPAMLRDTAREEGVGVQYFSFTVYFHSFFFLRVLSLSAGGRIEMLFLIFFSIPSPFGPLPYIFALQKHRGGLYGSFLHFIRYFTSLFPCRVP